MNILLDSISVSNNGFASARVYITGKNRRKLEKILYDAVAPHIKEKIYDIDFSKEKGITVRCSDLADAFRTKSITYNFYTDSQAYREVVDNLNIVDIFEVEG